MKAWNARTTVAATVACVAALFTPTVAFAGDGTFTPFVVSPITDPITTSADNVAVGDFDNDGAQDDIAVGRTKAAPNVTVLLGIGNGAFTSAGEFSAGPGSAGQGPEWTAVGDFNEDGNQDLAVANTSGSQVAILIGNGNGTFAAPVLLASAAGIGSQPREVAVGDFNNDQNDDLVVANSGSLTPGAAPVPDTVSVLLGNGAGAFAAAPGNPFAVGDFPDSLTVGDFDEDGRDDVAVANYFSNEVMVMRSAATGALTLASSQAAQTAPAGIGSGDFNGDGHLDVAIADDGTNDVTIQKGDGTGDLSPTQGSPYGTGARPQSLVVGQFEGDDRPDLATTNFDSANLTVLRGAGGALFGPEPGSPLASGVGPLGIAVGDLNSDGAEDLAVANFTAGSVTVLGGNGGFGDGGNLLQNGRAEGPTPARTVATLPDIPGWTDTNNLSYMRYSAPPEFPKFTVAQAYNGGSSFFVGGTSAASSATQTVDVSGSTASIDAGLASATLSGYLGGYSAQNDRMKVTATFLAGDATPLGSIVIGPVTSGDRLFRTVLLRRQASGAVPVGTRSIQVRLDATRATGSNNDGYGDNLSLTLSAPAPPPPPTPEPPPTTTTTTPETTTTTPTTTTPEPTPDTTPPETTISKGPKGKIDTNKAKFSFTATEAGSRFECKLDAGQFAACTSPKKLKHLADGKHTFQVRGIDQAGNADSTPARRAFRVKTD